MTKHITPRYKLMLFYDLKPQPDEEMYYQFVMNEMIPHAQEMGLYMFRVYHTIWGDCPLRQAEFVAENLDIVYQALSSDQWQAVEQGLLQHATNYSRKIVKFRPGFQC
ncbi:MAG: hypothetical protein JW966_15945 [Anaerolineae bacterium]|nr:hypothetical protein [Anaerolineae bacterium]